MVGKRNRFSMATIGSTATTKRLHRAFCLNLIAACWLALAAQSAAWADAPRWPEEPFSYYANQEPLADVLRALASSHGLAVVVSPKIDEVVSLSYTRVNPSEIFEQIVSAYNLTWYYDRHTLYVYRAADMQNQLIKLNRISVSAFEDDLRQIGVFDDRFYWRTIPNKGLIYVTGPERYIELIKEWVVALDSGPSQNKPAIYRWVDDRGITHFSSEPPPSYNRSEVEVMGLNKPPTVSEQSIILPAQPPVKNGFEN